MPTSTPVQFEPEAMQASVQRLLSFAPDCMYLTHYGRVGNVPQLGAQVLELLARTVAIGDAERGAANRHDVLKRRLQALYVHSLAAHGCTLDARTIAELLAIDIELNAQGMAVWLDRPSTKERS
jgi:hypothetical protein